MTNIHTSSFKSASAVFIVLVVYVFLFTAHLALAQSGAAPTQLIVLYDPGNAASPSASAVLSAFNGKASSGDIAIRNALGNPAAAELMIKETPSQDLQQQFNTYPLSARSILQQYLLLTYASSGLASSAYSLIAADARVWSVEQNAALGYSVTPNDRFFSYNAAQPFEGNYEWGMLSIYSPQAWDIERGNAYLGAIDTGIPCNPGCGSTSHPDLVQNFRPQFSTGYRTGTANSDFHDKLGHGSHVSGIISATPEYGQFSNGQANTGVAGTCWTCSFIMIASDLSIGSIVNSITYAADHGVQAVNMSWGDEYGTHLNTCGIAPHPTTAECTALAYAKDRDLVLVGASGNGYQNRVQWPAREDGVIAVGGVQFGGGFWRIGYGNGNTCTPGVPGSECGSNYGPEQQIVAPSKDIISTIGIGLDGGVVDYNTNVHCGDHYGPPGVDGYGDCTGTSMAAPHVTGIVGLIRSADPLMARTDVKSTLVSNTTACVGTDSAKCGNGIPNASAAVRSVIGYPAYLNRLTPLFSFYSTAGQDHFYTTVPQMAIAALSSGQLLPQPGGGAIKYDSIGSPIPLYSQFPTPACTFSPCFAYDTPEATVSIFVSHFTPQVGGVDLVPLYRYSFACTSGSAFTYCNTHPNDVSHVYSTDLSESWQYYSRDGIEGYVYSKAIAQPAGTVKLCRAYDPVRDDWVLYPGTGTSGTDCSATSDGLTGGNYYQSHDWLGWVFTARNPTRVCPSTGCVL